MHLVGGKVRRYTGIAYMFVAFYIHALNSIFSHSALILSHPFSLHKIREEIERPSLDVTTKDESR